VTAARGRGEVEKVGCCCGKEREREESLGLIGLS